MSYSKTKRAQRAADSLSGGNVIGLGNYTASENGDTSSSLKSVLAKNWVNHHDLEGGDGLDVWLDPESGALILLPEDIDER